MWNPLVAHRPAWTPVAGLDSRPTALGALVLGPLLLAALSWGAQAPAKEQFDDLARRAEAALDSRPAVSYTHLDVYKRQ